MRSDPARPWILALAALGFVAVAGGAFAAHALEEVLDAEAINRWQIGARYLAISTVPLLAVAWRRAEHPEDRLLRWSGLSTLGGACLFAATLWLMALTGQRWLGAITPLGGLGMLSGWLLLGLHAWRSGGARRGGTGTGSS